MTTLHRRVAIVVSGCALAVLSACGGSTSSDEQVNTSTPTPTAEASAPDLDGASVDPVNATSDDFGLLKDVRVAGHDRYDRVVFEFADDKLPGYTIEYADLPILEDGSGKPVDMPGASAALRVMFTPASSFDLNAAEPGPSYTGPREIKPADTGKVIQVVSAGDFEGQLVWAIGLPAKVPFTVTQLHDPARVVIDVEAP